MLIVCVVLFSMGDPQRRIAELLLFSDLHLHSSRQANKK
ncbi:hypothetical protein [Vibrio cholerae]|nr:hypothetical protein VCCP1035_0930 [Vibrio cholerae CP1035(8)]EMP88062.1 hypothetical protein VC116063_000892 [Vibrio cholerae O1 str. 116063]CQB51200.1 hypothetical protein [Vibrio cholerae]